MKIKAKELNATHIGMIYAHEYRDFAQYDFRIDKITIQNGYIDIEGENIHKGFRDAAGPAFETEITIVAPAKKINIEIDENELKTILSWYGHYSDYRHGEDDHKLVRKLESYEH